MSLSHRDSVMIALLVAGAFFMENLDGTVIATALPQMARSFHTSPVRLNIGMTAYLLSLAVFIPISGWVADRFGARSVFGAAVGIFTASSVLCGLCHGLWGFTAARIIQGWGGAMMVPVGRLVVLRTTEKQDLIRAIAYITWPGLVAPVIGPPLGGFLTTYASWRWIFFLNVPLGLIAMVLTALLFRNEESAEKKPFDGVGFILSGGACTGLMYGLDLISRRDSQWSPGVLLLALSLALAGLAVVHARRHPHPIVGLSSLRVPTFAVTIWGGSLFRIAIGATPFLLPLMFQIGFGMSAFASGLLVLSVFAGNLAMKPATSPLLRRFGFRTTLIGNGLLAAATVFACASLSPGTPKAVIVAVLFIGGLSRSMQFTGINTLGFSDIPAEEKSAASTLFSMVQQLTLGMGVAVGAVALRLAARLHHSSSGTPMLTDFHLAFVFVGLVALAGILDSFGLRPQAGAEISGHRSVHTAAS